MAIRNLRFDGDEVLRKKSKIVEVFDEKLAQLIDDMKDTMYKNNGVGMAAPQIGILKRIVVIDIGEGPIELVNPEIIEKSKRQVGKEGCLSCPDILGVVKRPYKVTAVGYDRNKNKIEITAQGLLARAICHELDHLDGILFKDHAKEIISREDIQAKIKSKTQE
ncbi:MAG: peptide deformylase [Oscillospiraceae bacterium]|nr:peptide deformylase [Oscillospiraceae bacterium]